MLAGSQSQMDGDGSAGGRVSARLASRHAYHACSVEVELPRGRPKIRCNWLQILCLERVQFGLTSDE
ncbi:hypothetical protein E2562_012465 [Oryza meyeriana var. granulata]|uniref:Uncharacterized protein n=1 Tax=Oryza meyeriana var. granulata TaxID=110450 RepID=A0A6G1C5Z3_9ORYZ|nr:hypothetical protein E2562_012465 [Oryza meyeriana var. granulata]